MTQPVYRCYFSLIRGLRCLCPCPICLVPTGKLSDLSAVYPERNQEHVKQLVRINEHKGAKEDRLKPFGLRATEVERHQCPPIVLNLDSI
jgi:hypothetical protein